MRKTAPSFDHDLRSDTDVDPHATHAGHNNSTGRGQAPARPSQLGPADFPFLLPPVEPDEIGRLGSYRILKVLGSGGMGIVFHAEDIALGRPVALKVMKPELEGLEGWQRFLREARTMAAIKHDHLVTIYQAGQEGGVAYFAMELLAGESLQDWLDRAPPPDAALAPRIGRELASGLAALHEHGVLHRDLKPANVWLEGPAGRVKLLDLGLARCVKEAVQLTQTGFAMGTPGFMSPEQAHGNALDARSDLFSLGCVLYCVCTGREPFQGDTVMALLMAVALDDPTPVHDVNPQIPGPLADLVMRLLEKKPADRPASAAAVLAELEQIDLQSPAPAPARRRSSKTRVLSSGVRKKKRSRPVPVPRRPWRKIALAIGAGLFGLTVLAAALLFWHGPPPRPHGNAPPPKHAFKHGEEPPHDFGPPSKKGFGPPPRGPVFNSPPAGAVFLSDLKDVAREHWPHLPPARPDGEVPGQVIRVGGQVAPHGIFMHPPFGGEAASLSYRLDRQFSTFRAGAALIDSVPFSKAPCTFWVYGDGQVLWKSSPVRRPEDAQSCEVTVKGVSVLRLAVSCPGEPHGAHMAWVEPCLTK